ncbi:nucleotidyltransferase family protein [Palleronia sp. LCG004]|uniref:nucleotidyltransferase family protein n=1 Tax=Palleronia sp. LCG004 TaxID=3079304 RepID=UPI0029427CD8|nr:nucleotidyltransferase family protein [Palleronia sp. LCG004]WOI57212.1 nucleotidyltransferase family protein [Palleronia sp. LCG004]
MDPTIAILAAGSSSRMRGGDKLLEQVNGIPLLRSLAIRALEVGLPVMVTLPEAGPRHSALSGLQVKRVPVPDAATGMSASFRAIGRSVLNRPVLCMLGDMPDIENTDLKHIHRSFLGDPDRVHRATSDDGRWGQPVLFPARLVARFATLTGDKGARSLLRREDVIPVPLPGERAITDLDTPEDWTAWRTARESRDGLD